MVFSVTTPVGACRPVVVPGACMGLKPASPRGSGGGMGRAVQRLRGVTTSLKELGSVLAQYCLSVESVSKKREGSEGGGTWQGARSAAAEGRHHVSEGVGQRAGTVLLESVSKT